MHYVYRIQSRNRADKSFIATSRDVKKRLALHNAGKVEATQEHCPWKLTFYAAFPKKERAKEFEEYLKSPEGKKFGRKHLWRSSSHSEPA
ncbi:MAG: GIY-YIG nuclease family protein [Kiritimatiellia bacterium]